MCITKTYDLISGEFLVPGYMKHIYNMRDFFFWFECVLLLYFRIDYVRSASKSMELFCFYTMATLVQFLVLYSSNFQVVPIEAELYTFLLICWQRIIIKNVLALDRVELVE